MPRSFRITSTAGGVGAEIQTSLKLLMPHSALPPNAYPSTYGNLQSSTNFPRDGFHPPTSRSMPQQRGGSSQPRRAITAGLGSWGSDGCMSDQTEKKAVALPVRPATRRPGKVASRTNTVRRMLAVLCASAGKCSRRHHHRPQAPPLLCSPCAPIDNRNRSRGRRPSFCGRSDPSSKLPMRCARRKRP